LPEPAKVDSITPSSQHFPIPLKREGLHNLFHVSDRLFSGSSPDGAVGFESLEKLGVKTVVSVDGARPDIGMARRFGMQYVHLPFGYDGVPPDRVLALAKVVSTLPGPIYVHCHHGKHRGPAAVAVMQLCSDHTWNADKADAWLKAAGTDPRYTGLVGLPRTLVRPTPEEIRQASGDYPAVAPVGDLAERMVAIDTSWENVKLIKAAKWTTPRDHPDIDPLHEVVQLIEHFRETKRLDAAKKRGEEFAAILQDAESTAVDLEKQLRADPVSADGVEKSFARMTTLCSACHQRFRDRGARP
jgi:protein tyrosine phosphatase (PTP) superfamily phosphohydrolase (DUF442 family)